MKYKVLWHDYEDDRSGQPIHVEANFPYEAFHKACKELDKIIGKPNQHHIEMLVDENGDYHHPDIFLNEGKSK